MATSTNKTTIMFSIKGLLDLMGRLRKGEPSSLPGKPRWKPIMSLLRILRKIIRLTIAR